ncbi:60S acidic ribosomal protein P2 [Camelus dromedarius]|uniref:Large ribosomal subunit protein P2 n=1 Tax=Camelus dromedarius TaxID=9838 RepID=A0A5N4E0Y7_CAMDR|nr:60S acidic ribosomal protein P2 [Camelus dromedarius]
MHSDLWAVRCATTPLTCWPALGGNASPSAKDIKKSSGQRGREADDDRLNKVISELNGKNIEDVIAQGIGKLASVPAGGAVAVPAAPGSAGPAAGSAPAVAEEKKEEKKEESEESDDAWRYQAGGACVEVELLGSCFCPWVRGELAARGIGKLASVPAGGAVAVPAAPGSAAPAAGSAPAVAEEKKEEKKEESEESDDDMRFGLFD